MYLLFVHFLPNLTIFFFFQKQTLPRRRWKTIQDISTRTPSSHESIPISKSIRQCTHSTWKKSIRRASRRRAEPKTSPIRRAFHPMFIHSIGITVTSSCCPALSLDDLQRPVPRRCIHSAGTIPTNRLARPAPGRFLRALTASKLRLWSIHSLGTTNMPLQRQQSTQLRTSLPLLQS